MALPDVEFRVLGPFQVLVGGRPVPIGSRKQRLVLLALTVGVDRVVGADALSLLLWDDVPPSSADVFRQFEDCRRASLGIYGLIAPGVRGGQGSDRPADAPGPGSGSVFGVDCEQLGLAEMGVHLDLIDRVHDRDLAAGQASAHLVKMGSGD